MEKRRFGDRKDGKLLRDIDGMHFMMPVIYPNRCDNEAFISERVDLTGVMKYVEAKNADQSLGKLTVFQVIVAALIKTVTLRPKLNRFIANKNLYLRNGVSAAFVIKKQFNDESTEGLAFVRADGNTTMDTIRADIHRQVTSVRSGKQDATSDVLDIFNKMPRFISKSLISFFCALDKHGKVPSSFIETDPFYATVVLSNLGSIKLHSGYHHLTNWGTNSLFVTVGEIKMRPFETENGEEMRYSVDLGITIDERIADGYYYSKSVRLLKHILENPELLDRPAGEETDYE